MEPERHLVDEARLRADEPMWVVCTCGEKVSLPAREKPRPAWMEAEELAKAFTRHRVEQGRKPQSVASAMSLHRAYS